MSTKRAIALWTALLTASLLLGGCDFFRKKAREKYFEYLETVGFEKREMLVKRVDKARNSQEKAQEQFEDALERFQALVGYDGGELETVYDALANEYEDAEGRAEKVRERIQKVENVAEILFEEWRRELEVFENESYRRQSEEQLRATQKRYGRLLDSMHRAADSMDPVLRRLQDQVLFLKHNLNAQALGSLDREAEVLQADISRLITDMQTSIAEADSFIAEMTRPAETG